MDLVKGKGSMKKGLISKTWERCKSFGGGGGKNSSRIRIVFRMKKSKSWHQVEDLEDEREIKKGRVAPEGCFSVYVGPQRQRFVIRTEYVNHPLFKVLLEEAEFEYGYNSDGPIKLPCKVDHFLKVLLEMDPCDEVNIHQGCTSFATKRHISYHPLTRSRIITTNNF